MSVLFKIGNKYGKLRAVKDLGLDEGKRVALFQCDCGGSKTAFVTNVQRGSTRSCGCLKREVQISSRLPTGEAQFRYAYDRTRRSAEKRNYLFRLTPDQFREIITKPCHYCGALPVFRRQKTYFSGMAMNGVDRVNNNVGYTVKNSVPCCPICNIAKGEMSLKEFKNWIAKVNSRLNP